MRAAKWMIGSLSGSRANALRDLAMRRVFHARADCTLSRLSLNPQMPGTVSCEIAQNGNNSYIFRERELTPPQRGHGRIVCSVERETQMVAHHLGDALPAGAALLRNEPVQARSTARLTALLDAAAAVVDEIGYERLTTAMVAERAGASIGTVYRYFPDRIAVLQSLSARNLSEFTARGLPVPRLRAPTSWPAVDGCRSGWDRRILPDSEPGFKSLRFGDVLDVRPRARAATGNGAVAGQIVADPERAVANSATTQNCCFRVEVATGTGRRAARPRLRVQGRPASRSFIAEARKVVGRLPGGILRR